MRVRSPSAATASRKRIPASEKNTQTSLLTTALEMMSIERGTSETREESEDKAASVSHLAVNETLRREAFAETNESRVEWASLAQKATGIEARFHQSATFANTADPSSSCATTSPASTVDEAEPDEAVCRPLIDQFVQVKVSFLREEEVVATQRHAAGAKTKATFAPAAEDSNGEHETLSPSVVVGLPSLLGQVKVQDRVNVCWESSQISKNTPNEDTPVSEPRTSLFAQSQRRADEEETTTEKIGRSTDQDSSDSSVTEVNEISLGIETSRTTEICQVASVDETTTEFEIKKTEVVMATRSSSKEVVSPSSPKETMDLTESLTDTTKPSNQESLSVKPRPKSKKGRKKSNTKKPTEEAQLISIAEAQSEQQGLVSTQEIQITPKVNAIRQDEPVVSTLRENISKSTEETVETREGQPKEPQSPSVEDGAKDVYQSIKGVDESLHELLHKTSLDDIRFQWDNLENLEKPPPHGKSRRDSEDGGLELIIDKSADEAKKDSVDPHDPNIETSDKTEVITTTNTQIDTAKDKSPTKDNSEDGYDFPKVPSISSELEELLVQDSSQDSKTPSSTTKSKTSSQTQTTAAKTNNSSDHCCNIVCDKHSSAFNIGMESMSSLCDHCADTVLPYVAVLQNLLDNMMTTVLGGVPVSVSNRQCLWCLKESAKSSGRYDKHDSSHSHSRDHHHAASHRSGDTGHHSENKSSSNLDQSSHRQHQHRVHKDSGNVPHHTCPHHQPSPAPHAGGDGSRSEILCYQCHPQEHRDNQQGQSPQEHQSKEDKDYSVFHVGKPGEHTNELPERWTNGQQNEEEQWYADQADHRSQTGKPMMKFGGGDDNLLSRWHQNGPQKQSSHEQHKSDAKRRSSVGDRPTHLVPDGRRRSWASSGNPSDYVAAPGSLATTPTFPPDSQGRRGRQSLSRSSSTDKLLSYVQELLPPPEDPKEENEAYVTIATNNSTALGCLVLGNSLRLSGTSRTLVAIITDGVSGPMRHLLASVFHSVQSVRSLDAQGTTKLSLLEQPDLGVSFMKLHIWRLVQFTKCVFLDSSALVIQNSDELFDREELSAVPDIGWPDCFSTNVFVYKPSLETFWGLINFAEAKGSFDGGDHGLLNMYFRNWVGDMSKRLPFIYNLAANVSYTYTPAFRQFGRNVKIVHFMGSYKPWNVPFHAATYQMSPSASVHPTFAQFVQYWIDIFGKRIFPLFSDVIQCHAYSQKYITAQELLVFLPAPTVPESIEALPTPPSFRKYPETEVNLPAPVVRKISTSEKQRKTSTANGTQNGVPSGESEKTTESISVADSPKSEEQKSTSDAQSVSKETTSSEKDSQSDQVEVEAPVFVKKTDIPGSDVGDFRGMAAWEQGNVDYLGHDSSDNILRRLDFLIGKPS